MPNEFRVKRGLIVETTGSATGSNAVTVDGVAGRLFTVVDTFSGSLFSVNTVAGLPVIEAFSDNTVRIGQFGQRALFVSQSRVGIGKEGPLNAILDVSGSATVTGSFTVTQPSGIELQVTSTGVNIGNSLIDNHIVSGNLNINGNIVGAEPIPAGAKLYLFNNY